MHKDMENDETATLLISNVKNVELDAHCTEAAVVVKYELDGSSSTDSDSTRHLTRFRRGQRIVRLKDLNENVKISALAKYVIKCCPFISERRIPELEQILYFLRKRQRLTTPEETSETELNVSAALPTSAIMNNVEDYIEMLYEDIDVKVKGTIRLLQLSKNVANVKSMVENEALVGALTRVLRDDWKKCYDLATNIVSIFYNFSLYSDFHPAIAQYKIGTLCMQLIDFELKRWDALQCETRISSERNVVKKSSVVLKQQVLVSICINLLLNLAEDIKVELKMLNRNLIAMLTKCIADRNASPNLLIGATSFLLKLSVFYENRQAVVNARVVEVFSELFPIQDEALRRVVIRFLFNLSFDASVCNQMVSSGLVSHIAPFIEKDACSLNLMYHLSMNDDAKAMIAYTDTIRFLMRQLVNGMSTEVSKALLLNIALEKRNAQLICGSDGSGLDIIATAALEKHDHLLVKILRNIALHSGPSQIFFSKWATRLLKTAIAESNDESMNLGYAIDCLGIVNLLNCLQWKDLVEELSLMPWIERLIVHDKEPRYSPDFLLQIIILCGTMARQPSVARLLIPLVNQFIFLLSAQQEDDEMVMQIVYLFYVLINHEELSGSLIGGDAQIGAYLLDLMHDRNLPIRSLCDAALTIIADRSEEWTRKMDVERFRWHNAHWLEMVADSNGVASRDSTLSGSPDPSNVFGAEELLDDSDSVIPNNRFDQDF